MEERARIFLNLVNVYCELKEFDQAKIKEIKDQLHGNGQGTESVGEFLVDRDYNTSQDEQLFLREVYYKYAVNKST